MLCDFVDTDFVDSLMDEKTKGQNSVKDPQLQAGRHHDYPIKLPNDLPGFSDSDVPKANTTFIITQRSLNQCRTNVRDKISIK